MPEDELLEEQSSADEAQPDVNQQVNSQMAGLAEAIASLDAHVADASRMADDEELRGRGPSPATIGSIILLAIAVIATVVMFSIPHQDIGIPAGIFCVILSFVMAVFVIGSLLVDHACRHMQLFEDPVKAYKAWFKAVKGSRMKPVFAAIVPAAREVEVIRPLGFEKIPEGKIPDGFHDAKTLGKYWKYVLRGPSSQNRTVKLDCVRKVKDLPGDVAVIQAAFEFSSHSQATAFVLGALIAMLTQKKEKKKIRKLMIRRDDRWYFVSGEFEGELDTLGEYV